MSDAYADAAEIEYIAVGVKDMVGLGFSRAGYWEPLRPYACNRCGCLVSVTLAKVHVEVCAAKGVTE